MSQRTTTAQPETRFTVTVQGHPPSPNDRLHHMARYRINRTFKEAVSWQSKAGWKQPPLQRARLQVTLVYTRRPFKDEDGAVSCVKNCVDGLIGTVIVDDNPEALEWMPVQQILGLKREVILDIWPAGEEVN